MRQIVVAGNWKMNKTIAQSIEFVQNFKEYEIKGDTKVIICCPFTDLYVMSKQLEGTSIKLAAQNMHFAEQGAFTGEVSPVMLIENNVEYVILGHSERRQYFNETDETVNKKALAALKFGLKPIICCGETLEQREQGITNDWVKSQIENALVNIDENDMLDVIIAYEPIWAIGTGKTATSEDANEVCGIIRETIGKLYNEEVAQKVIIQYGGSVNAKTANELFNMEHIDGGLVGGASLKPDEFIKIVNYDQN